MVYLLFYDKIIHDTNYDISVKIGILLKYLTRKQKHTVENKEDNFCCFHLYIYITSNIEK